MSNQVTVDATLQAKLATANGHAVRLCDESGKVVGYALTTEQARRYEIEYAKTRLSGAEIEQILATPGGYSMEDVFKLLERS